MVHLGVGSREVEPARVVLQAVRRDVQEQQVVGPAAVEERCDLAADDVLELSDASPEQQEKLIAAFLARNAAG